MITRHRGCIAARLGRHKSWVCRRLMLVEALDPAVQADVRLGLLMPRAAPAVGQLPRGNQPAAAEPRDPAWAHRAADELRVAELMDGSATTTPASTADRTLDRRRALAAARGPACVRRGRPVARRTGSRRISAPCEAWWRGFKHGCPRHVRTIGPEAASLLRGSLMSLAPVLHELQRTLALASEETDVLGKEAA